MNSALDLHPKVVGGGLAGSLTILLVWLLGLAHVTVDPIVAAAMTAAIGSFGAWLSPILRKEVPATK